MSFTLCSSGAAVADAGVNVNTTILGDAVVLGNWSDQAEGKICAECHTDFVTNFAALPTQIQGAIEDICSAMIAMQLVKYDQRGYLRREADTLMNVLDDRIIKGLAKLKEKEFQRFSA